MAGNKEEIKKLSQGMEVMYTEDGDRLAVISIRKRKIPLRIALRDVKYLSDEIGNVSEIQDLMKDNLLSGENIERIIKMIRIMGNSGLRAMGEPADLTDDWVGDRLKLTDVTEDLMVRLMLTLYGAMDMETEEAEEEGKPIDVVLRDLRKKNKADN